MFQEMCDAFWLGRDVVFLQVIADLEREGTEVFVGKTVDVSDDCGEREQRAFDHIKEAY